MKKIITKLFAHWHNTVACAVLAVLFSGTNAFLSPVYWHASLDNVLAPGAWPSYVLQTVLWALPIFVLLRVVFAYGGQFLTWLARFNPLKRLTLAWSKTSVLATAAIILVLWIPWIVIYFPGSTPYDPVAQIYQIHGSGALRPEIWEPTMEGWISNTHPILHTLILGGFFELGNALGSQNLGIFMYTCFQCVVRALCFGTVCCYLRRLRVPKWVCLAALAFYALFPAISTSSVVTFKDHLFSPLYVMYLLQIIEIVRSRGGVLRSRGFMAGFLAVSLLLPLFKHPGLYIVLFVGLVLAITYRRHWRALAASAAVPAVVVLALLPGVVFPLLNVTPAGSQDMFGPFFAQTARVIEDNPDAMSAKDREIIDKVVPYRVMATGYNITSTDYIKGNFRQDSTWPERLDYLMLWLRQGFEYPKEYFEGFFTLQDTWFVTYHGWDVHDNLYPATAQNVVDLVGHNNRLPVNETQEVRGKLNFDGPVELYGAKLFMRNNFLYLHTLPIVGVLFSNGLYTFFLPFVLAALILLNKRRLAPALWPVLLTWVVLLISPMDMSRYALPMLEATPLVLGLAVVALRHPERRCATLSP